MYAATLSGTRPSNGLPFAASARTSVEDTGNTGALANSTVPPSAASPAAYFPHRSRVLARAQVRHKNDAAQQLPVRRPVAEPEQHIAAHGKIKLCAGIPRVHLPHGINGIAFAAARDLRGIQHQLRKQRAEALAHGETVGGGCAARALMGRRTRRLHQHKVRPHRFDGPGQQRHMAVVGRVERAAEQNDLSVP